MRPGGHTPEELKTLFEDAIVIRDRGALALLFEDDAVLVTDAAAKEARGEDIAGMVAAMWNRDVTYLADPQRVLQARDTALVLRRRASTSCAGEPTADGDTRSPSWTTATRPKGRTDDSDDPDPDAGSQSGGGAW